MGKRSASQANFEFQLGMHAHLVRELTEAALSTAGSVPSASLAAGAARSFALVSLCTWEDSTTCQYRKRRLESSST